MSDELKNRIYNYELDPPRDSWAKIVAVLDDESMVVSQRLSNIEIAPPPECWTTISALLEAQDGPDLSRKLYNLETKPPVESWENIAGSLRHKLPAVDPNRQIRRIIKYFAAAFMVGMIVFGALRILSRDAKQSPPTVTAPRKEPTPTEPADSNSAPPVSNVISEDSPRQALVASKITDAARKESLSDAVPVAAATIQPDSAKLSSSPGQNFGQAALRGEIPGNCSSISEMDPYSMFLNPDGYLIRMSRKMAETLGCSYIFENSQDNGKCEGQLSEWRKKIAESPENSSTDNFMDVVNLVRSAHND